MTGKNNLTIDLNVLCAAEERTYFGYVSKHSLNRKKQEASIKKLC